MSSLSFVQRTFDWDGGNSFVRRGKRRGTRAPLSPRKYFKKGLISRQTLEHFGTLDMKKTLNNHLMSLFIPQPHVVFFRLAYQFRNSKHTNLKSYNFLNFKKCIQKNKEKLEI